MRRPVLLLLAVGIPVAIVTLFLVAIVTIALALPMIQQSREAARREAVKQNLKQLGEALHQYQQRQSPLPASAETPP